MAVARRLRRSAADAKFEILEAAERHLAEAGPNAVRVQKIGAELGLTDAAIHYHFGNREGLLEALLHHAGRKIRGAFAVPALPLTGRRLLDAIVAQLDDVYRRKGYARLAMWLVLAGWRPRGSGMLLPIAERLHASRTVKGTIDDTRLKLAALNVFMVGDALSGENMLTAAGLPQTQAMREALRRVFVDSLAREMGLG